ncbi:hypothetical protein ILUMI_05433 [Ignelater luminosus]|uniref:Aminopeptidase N-like N-terminal domain-containing protein n=1 Tax=Ignelater luminosus TaxID=2038154 RepID=A0A8K0GI45_IGNLU|nr:hypothetical protein ILUMI_05433 [Ignelater luminosus]
MALGAILLSALAVGLTILLYSNSCEAAPEALTQKSAIVATRLPTNLEPLHYRLQLMPFLNQQNFTTNGAVSVTLNVIEDTDKIAINMYDITVHNDSVKVKHLNQSENIEVTDQKYDNISQIYTIYLKDSLKKGELYELEIKFISKLNDKMQGFYRSHYIDPKTNTTKWMASTQFSPTDARRAFPCFDEPSFKAKFTISIARPNNMTTISNMPKRATDPM